MAGSTSANGAPGQHPPVEAPASAGPASDASALQDILLLAGMLESVEAQPLLDTLRNARVEALEKERISHEQLRSSLDALVKTAEDERERRNKRRAELRTEIDGVETQLNALNSRTAHLLTEVAAAARRLYARRTDYPLRLLEMKVSHYTRVAKDTIERLLGEQRQKLEFQKVLHALALEARTLNRDEYDRRVAVLQDRRRHAEQRFQDHDNYIAILRGHGITRTTAGFLVWAGYLALAALGWFVGETLQHLHKGGATLLLSAFTLLASALDGLVSYVGFLPAFSLVILSPVALAVVLFGLVWCADILLRRFDNGWEEQGGTRNPGSRRRDTASWMWLSNPTRQIFRSDYTQTLARIPLTYMWVTLPLLLIALAVGLSSQSPRTTALPSTLPDPSQTILYTYFGTVLCVIVAAGALLYSTSVIQPRMRLRSEQPLPVARVPASLSTHWELVAVLAIVAFMLLFSGFLSPLSPRYLAVWGRDHTAGIFTLVVLCSFVLAYGMLYRGLFRDHTTLRAEAHAYEALIQRYSALPVVDRHETDLDRFTDELSSMHRQVERLWDDNAFWAAPRVDLSKGGLILRLLNFRPPSAARTAPAIAYVNADDLLEPVLVEQLNAHSSALEQARSELESSERRRAERQMEYNALIVDNLDATLTGLHAQRAALEQDHRARVATIEHTHHERLTHCETAYRMGVFLRTSGTMRGLRHAHLDDLRDRTKDKE